MLSKQEIWTIFVKRVLASSNDISSAAVRLHQGHDLIFGKTKDSYQLDEIRELAKKKQQAFTKTKFGTPVLKTLRIRKKIRKALLLLLFGLITLFLWTKRRIKLSVLIKIPV